MAPTNQSSQFRGRPRNIVFFGETGSGKSSIINLLAGSRIAHTSNDTDSCTRINTCYKATVRNEAFNLWDTRGLGEGFLRSLFKRSSEGELRKFLRERHEKCEIDLLVYCVRGSRANKAQVKSYKVFGAVTRQLAAPVVIAVTYLERETDMEDWWTRNESSLLRLGMEFDGHACITASPIHHPQADVSRGLLQQLIARNYHWQAKRDGSYFGSPVHQGQRAPAMTGSTRGVHNDHRPGPTLPHINTTFSERQSSAGTGTYSALSIEFISSDSDIDTT
ncbi:hypothetical protein PAXRUDRAFT_624711 [Paxillus rubicundulus Ve08.2h10]|uniref:Unplaced genomic scaffold scaffold_550, whole genome shotgun sequence n=1 Tax=Paxillus rubicundulus Ve08.2h10 TaxID=930991 RepID=A0A0D0DT28_9AGAM|nr:hypothetical protein PAXRUDRAFT_624711 [Paxillus rubicundulus Ve08.2h10]